MQNKDGFSLWISVLAVLAVAALGAFIYQFSEGLVVTGMNNLNSWGLYIIGFMFLVGLSAGGLIVSSSATVFNIPSFKAVAKPAVLLSAVCIILAGMMIIIDLGSPQRFLNLLIYGRAGSPLMWDVVVITLYLITSLLYLYLMTRPNPNQKTLKVMSFIALPVAVLVHSVTAWIFGLLVAQPTWNSALMAPLFVASALDSGLALLIIVLVALNKFSSFKFEKSLMSTLGGMLAVFITVDIFMVLSELLTMAFPGSAEEMVYVDVLLKGDLSFFYWGELVIGGLLPFLLLAFGNRQKPALIVGASAMVVIGVFFKRVWLVFSSYAVPLINDAPGVTTGRWQPPADLGTVPNIWVTLGSYAPTWVEGLIFVGIFAFGALLFTLGYKYVIEEKSTVGSQTARTAAIK